MFSKFIGELGCPGENSLVHKNQVLVDQRHKPDTLSLIKEKVGNSLVLIGMGDNFLNRTAVSQTLISTINI